MSIKSIISLSLIFGSISYSFAEPNYCAGIRGNGELAPAHWASMAKIIENKGFPKTVSGGSSAAISLFLLDSVSRNKNLNDSESVKRTEQALLVKTLVPHIEYLLAKDAKVPVIMRLVGNITGIAKGGFISGLKKAVQVARDVDDFFEVLGKYGPLLNPELVKGLKSNFSFYKKEIAESISVFGAFDARDDLKIFYRSGLVDFKFLAVIFGRIGDFYAGNGDRSVNKKMSEFLNHCAPLSKDKLWEELATQNPECKKLLHKSLADYYGPKRVRTNRQVSDSIVRPTTKLVRKFPNKMIFEAVGSGLDALPTTAIIHGEGAKKYKRLLKKYISNKGKNLEDFSLNFYSDLSYGYWGRQSSLEKIANNRDSADIKSSKFLAMPKGTWFEVLATSPAEPGLANIQRVPDSSKLKRRRILNKRYFSKLWGFIPTLSAVTWFNEKSPSRGIVPFREGIYSAGGWSDLHPTLVLKARGCDDIVYVTRQGGESVFGQQIFIRLTGYTDKIRFWRDIKEGNRRGWTDLSEEERNSPWNKLYNLANPTSSFNRSIEAANAVYCTDWDRFYIFKGEVKQTLKDAYSAPVFVRTSSERSLYPFGLEFEGKSPDNFPGCILK